MNTQIISAILLIVGDAFLLMSALIGPRGIYQTPDLHRRIQIIEEGKTRWNVAQSLIGLSLLITASGFTLLASHFRTTTHGWVPVLGATLFAVGTISGLFFLYRQTVDPLSTYQGSHTSFESLYYWLAIAGLLFFGITFLLASLPAWLGYTTMGITMVYAIFIITRRVGYLTPGLVTILSLMIAIVLLSQ